MFTSASNVTWAELFNRRDKPVASRFSSDLYGGTLDTVYVYFAVLVALSFPLFYPVADTPPVLFSHPVLYKSPLLELSFVFRFAMFLLNDILAGGVVNFVPTSLENSK